MANQVSVKIFCFKLTFFYFFRYILQPCDINSCLPQNTKFQIAHDSCVRYIRTLSLGKCGVVWGVDGLGKRL